MRLRSGCAKRSAGRRFLFGKRRVCGRGDLVQVDGVARSLPQRRPLARRVSPTAHGRGSRVVGIPHRDSRRGGAQRFFVRRTAAQPARVVSSAEVAVPAPGATGLPTSPSVPCSRPARPYRGAPGPDETGSCADRPSGPSSRRSAAGSFDIRSRLPDFYPVLGQMALVRSGGFDVSSGKVGDAGGRMFSF